MRHNIRFLLIVTMLLLMTGIGTAQKFVHPGIDMNPADLEYMRNQVLAGEQPWKDATTVQRNYPIGSVDLNRNHSSDVLV